MFVIQKIRAYGLALAVLTLPLSVFHAQAEEARIWSSQDSIDAPSDALLETQSVPQTGPSDFWLGETGTTISDADVPVLFDDLEDLQTETTPERALAEPAGDLDALISSLEPALPVPEDIVPDEILKFRKKLLQHPSLASERAVFLRRKAALNSRLSVIRQQVRENQSAAKTLGQTIEIYRPLVAAGHETKLALIELEGQHTQAKLASERAQHEYDATVSGFIAESAHELAAVRTQADQAGAREDAFRAKVRHAGVRAPTDGIISALHIETIGAVVQGGEVMAEIVPDEQEVLINARVKPEDIASIYPGQVAQVSLSAYDVSRYGNLEGNVQRIAANTTEEPNALPYYQTMVAIPSARLSKSDEEVDIKPGMAVTVDIIGKKRSVLSYIFTPLNRAAGVVFREN
jgi:multidrug efflux pump subunit AcrA (membrane-fusion protein)